MHREGRIRGVDREENRLLGLHRLPGNRAGLPNQEPRRRQVPEDRTARHMQFLRQKVLLPARKAVLRLRGRRRKSGEGAEGIEVRHQNFPRRRRQTGLAFPADKGHGVDPPRLRREQMGGGDLLREDAPEARLFRRPLREAARAPPIRSVQKGPPQGAQDEENRHPRRPRPRREDARRLPGLHRRPQKGDRHPIRFRRRQKGRQNGDTHDNVPQVQPADREAGEERRPVVGQKGDRRRDVEADSRGLSKRVRGLPLRQRHRIRDVLRNRRLREIRRRNQMPRLLRQAIPFQRQSRMREEPRVRAVRIPQGEIARRADPRGRRRGVRQHQFARPRGKGRPNAERGGRARVREGLSRGARNQEDRQKEGQVSAANLTFQKGPGRAPKQPIRAFAIT